MAKIKCNKLKYLFAIILVVVTFTSCWNYREIEKLGIVTGIAIDYNEESSKYIVTFEIVDMQAGDKASMINTQVISNEGDSIFEAIRISIKSASKKLYFSHAQVLIIGKDIAERGIIPALDFINRHGETRHNIAILVSSCEASKLFTEKKNTSEILSYKIAETIKVADENLPIIPKIDLWQFVNRISAEDESAVLPMIHEIYEENITTLDIDGAGIFKGQKLIGYLDGEETRMLLFIRDEIKDGILVIKDIYEDKAENVSIEITESKTKITPHYLDGTFIMNINIRCEVVLGENTGFKDFNSEEGMKKLKDTAEQQIEKEAEQLIKKVQREYGSDIFGFGKAIRVQRADLWKKYKKDWRSMFLLVEAEVKVDMAIKNSGMQGKPTKVGY